MINNINELVAETIDRRIEDIYNNIIIKDERYSKIENKIISMIDEIKVLEELINEQAVLAGEKIYMYAIKDLIEFRKF
ncbi:MAG: hypothetical protein F8N39_01200 [Clostridiaceae bacterium]|nr:hypothetical protein [Clostridiaceae bacterium]